MEVGDEGGPVARGVELEEPAAGWLEQSAVGLREVLGRLRCRNHGGHTFIVDLEGVADPIALLIHRIAVEPASRAEVDMDLACKGFEAEPGRLDKGGFDQFLAWWQRVARASALSWAPERSSTSRRSGSPWQARQKGRTGLISLSLPLRTGLSIRTIACRQRRSVAFRKSRPLQSSFVRLGGVFSRRAFFAAGP